MHIFNFKAPFLLQFIYMKFRISVFEFFHYIDIGNAVFELDYNLLIIYNFDFIFYGDFF